MIQLEFTTEVIDQLRHEKRYHPPPHVRKKMEALCLKSQGMPHHQICQLVGMYGRATLVRYFREYQEGGLVRLQKLNFRRPESILMQHRDKIEEAISAYAQKIFYYTLITDKQNNFLYTISNIVLSSTLRTSNIGV
ncbi:MAG: hypothetical protein ACKN9W_14065 [Methylococcus sp.]